MRKCKLCRFPVNVLVIINMFPLERPVGIMGHLCPLVNWKCGVLASVLLLLLFTSTRGMSNISYMAVTDPFYHGIIFDGFDTSPFLIAVYSLRNYSLLTNLFSLHKKMLLTTFQSECYTVPCTRYHSPFSMNFSLNFVRYFIMNY